MVDARRKLFIDLLALYVSLAASMQQDTHYHHHK